MLHYLSFGGRSGRVEFILVFFLSRVLVKLGLKGLLFLTVSGVLPEEDLYKWVLFLVNGCGGYILLTSVSRRLHDLGFSFWWLLLGIAASFVVIPLSGDFIGEMIMVGIFGILCFFPGEKGPNQFGPEPDLLTGFFVQPEEESSENSEENEQETGRIDFKL